MKEIIATRHLEYSKLSELTFKKMKVQIGMPFKADLNGNPTEGSPICYCCNIYVVNADGENFVEKVCGADEVQAINLASNIDPLVRRMSKNIYIRWPSGEEYFKE